MMLTNRAPFDYASSTALITGASRGIGAELARQIADRGANTLVLVARSQEDLDTLSEELYARYQTHVEIIVADLSDAAAPAAIKEETDRRGLHIDLLVNNAGFGSYGLFEELDPAHEQSMIAVNVASLVALTRFYLPEMVRKGRGGILNVASTAGFQPVPFMSTYGATKAFVLSFSEALWAEAQEREGDDVRVICLCPGNTESHFADNLKERRGRFENVPASSAEDVARGGLDALDQDASYRVVGGMNYAGTLAIRAAPRAAVARVSASLFRPIKEKESGVSYRRTLAAGLAIAAGVAAGGYAVYQAFKKPMA
jgi:short-subunit dehydrogenase